MKLKLYAFILMIFAMSAPSRAELVFDPNSTVRALGMGNAYTTLCEDSSCLFYNPAGLARVTGLNFKLFGLHAGGMSMDQYQTFLDLTDASTFVQTIQDNYGKPLWVNAGGETAFYMPMFAVSVYQHIDASFFFTSPQATTIKTHFLNDLGYTLGVGIPLGPFVEVGTALRYVRRAGTNVDLGPADLANLDVSVLESAISNWGRGYGADVGMNFILPAGPFKMIAGASWKNIGITRYKSAMRTPVPEDDNDVSVGLGFKFYMPLVSITPAIDFKHLTQDDVQVARKINFGVEIGLPLVDIRGGFNEGYYTAGVGMDLGLFKVDAATYGVELGTYPGQLEERRYVAEFTMEIGLGSFSASPNAKGADSSSGGGGSGAGGKGGSKGSGSSSSKSLWGTSGRLKQRR